MSNVFNHANDNKPSPPPYPFHSDSMEWDQYHAALDAWERDQLADGFDGYPALIFDAA